MVTKCCAAHTEVSGCPWPVLVTETTESTRRCSVWRHSTVTKPSLQPHRQMVKLYSEFAQMSDKEQVYLLGVGQVVV